MLCSRMSRHFHWFLGSIIALGDTMSDTVTTINGVTALVCAPEGQTLASENDAVDLIGEALSSGAELVVIPVERLDPAFFQLSTRVAGLFMQKLVNYRRRLVILGDISAYVAASQAFHDFVYESNRGNQIWFL